MSIAQFIDATDSNDMEVQFLALKKIKTSFVFERGREKYNLFLEIILRYLKTANVYKKNSKMQTCVCYKFCKFPLL